MVIESIITGRCMEGAGGMDGDHVRIDTEIFPRCGDLCWCVIDGRNMVKRYDAEAGGICFVSTVYANGWEGKPFQMGLMCSRDAICGTVVEVLGADGVPKWQRLRREVKPVVVRWINAEPVQVRA